MLANFTYNRFFGQKAWQTEKNTHKIDPPSNKCHTDRLCGRNKQQIFLIEKKVQLYHVLVLALNCCLLII